jgi:hypothetical protein
MRSLENMRGCGVCWDEYVIQSACWSASRDLPLEAVRHGIQEPLGCCKRGQELYA